MWGCSAAAEKKVLQGKLATTLQRAPGLMETALERQVQQQQQQALHVSAWMLGMLCPSKALDGM